MGSVRSPRAGRRGVPQDPRASMGRVCPPGTRGVLPVRAASTGGSLRPTVRFPRGRVWTRTVAPQGGSPACAVSSPRKRAARAAVPRAVKPDRGASMGRGRQVTAALDRAMTSPRARRPTAPGRARTVVLRGGSPACGARTTGGLRGRGRWRLGASTAARRREAAVREMCPVGKAIRRWAAGPRAAGAGRGSSRRAPPGGTCSFPRRGRRRGGVRAGRCLRARVRDGRVGRISR